jgi:hypothetical protein
MRDFKGMKRQRGRNRGGNAGQGGNGGKPQQHNANRSFESNGPDNVKIRGNAQHVFEKYQQLARDASSSGDRVLAENYLQHAEHYFRVVRAVQPLRPIADIIGRDSISSGYDIDFEDESGAQADPGEAPPAEGDNPTTSSSSDNDGGEPRQEREWVNRSQQDRDRDRGYNRDDRPRDDRQQQDRPRDSQQQDRYRDERPRDDRQQQDRSQDRQRDDRPRDDRQDRQRDDRPRSDAPRTDTPRSDAPRDDRQRDDRPPRRDRFGRDRFERGDRAARDPMAVVEPESTPLTAAAPAEPEQRQLRSQDGSLSPAPAFLQARTDSPPRAVIAAETEDGEVKKPRRRRAPKTFEGGEGEAPAKAETEEV